MVSLQNNPRLRKLRNYEGEDLVSGNEYTKRLRRQFERLYPAPDWASRTKNHKHQTGNINRSFNTFDASNQDSSSEGEVSVGFGGISVPPLAKLLQTPGAFVQAKTHISTGKRKLRPELIDMQRTKDVGGAQPVSINLGRGISSSFANDYIPSLQLPPLIFTQITLSSSPLAQPLQFSYITYLPSRQTPTLFLRPFIFLQLR